jgi:hypothetical protein
MDAITKIVAFPWKENIKAVYMGIDPSVSLNNYRICGASYRALTRHFAGEAIQPEELMTFPDPTRIPYYQTLIAERVIEVLHEKERMEDNEINISTSPDRPIQQEA